MTIKRKFLKSLVKDRKLKPAERIGQRLGYMSAAFIMMSPYLLPYGKIGAITYIVGGVLGIPQVWLAKQWNLVLINVNVAVGYIVYLYGII